MLNRLLILSCALLVGCGGDDSADFPSKPDGGSGSGGTGAVGTGGAPSGGAAGTGTGGATGGAAGSSTGGAAGTGVGGAAGSGTGGATGGAAGSSTGGAAGSGTGGATGGSGGATGGTGGIGATGGIGGVGGVGGSVNVTGCSDGTREAFKSLVGYPSLAGCSGGWSVPGVATTASFSPTCGRISGNTSVNPTGNGCSVEDLCAEGWHVCASRSEVSQKSGATAPGCATDATNAVWITRQAQTNTGSCANPPAVNNVVGCGSGFGFYPGSGCSPLNRGLRYSDCEANPPWSCGSQTQGAFEEANIVVKKGPDHGGVICCKN